MWLPYRTIYRYDDELRLAYLCATYGNPTELSIPSSTTRNNKEYTVAGIDRTAFLNYNTF